MTMSRSVQAEADGSVMITALQLMQLEVLVGNKVQRALGQAEPDDPLRKHERDGNISRPSKPASGSPTHGFDPNRILDARIETMLGALPRSTT
jgi:hypothetical protein